MTLRTRVTVAAAAAVFLAISTASIATYLSIRHELRSQVDTTLRTQAQRFPPTFPGTELLQRPPPARESGQQRFFSDSYLQILDESGRRVSGFGEQQLPVDTSALAVARGEGAAFFKDVSIAGSPVRVYTVPLTGGAVQFGRSLDEVDRSLSRLTVTLLVVSLGGMVLAAIFGRLIANAATRPVHRLSEAAEAIAQTGDLTRLLPADGRDELSSLARTFNLVLNRLSTSQALQRQLVADASHELRTPLTTLRTNIEVLAREPDLEDGDRARLLSDLTGQLEDLTGLVGDLVDLAREDATEVRVESIRLDELVADAAAKMRRHRPLTPVVVESRSTTITGAEDRIERAIINLIDNAAKWSPPGSPVHVTVQNATVIVQDQGPGIAPEDLPYVFDRFYRSVAARSMPGSGLGLAIVRQVAESHGGSVTAENVPEGGARVTLMLSAGSHP